MTDIIDMHVHYYPELYLQALIDAPSTKVSYRESDGRFVLRWRDGIALTVPQPHPGLEQRLETMDEVGIGIQVLSIGTPSVFFVEDEAGDRLARAVNESLAEIHRAYPSRFRGLGSVPLQSPTKALKTLEYLLDDLHLDGVMILTNVSGHPLDHPKFDAFWEAANDLGLLVYVHPTIPVAGNMSDFALSIGVGFIGDTNLALARLAFSGIFERFPRIRWVFSHLGGSLPFTLPRVDNYHRNFPEFRERAPRLPSEYIREQLFDTASTHRPAIRCASEVLGVDRLVFGSDYPHVGEGIAPFIEALEATGASGTELDEIRSGRATTLLSGEAV